MSNCMSIVRDLDEQTQTDLLSRVDAYLEAGVVPKDAQRMAVEALLTELERGQAQGFDGELNLSAAPFPGSTKAQAVVIELGDKTPDEVQNIYSAIRSKAPNVSSQSYAGGLMTILNVTDWTGIGTDELMAQVDNALGGVYHIANKDFYYSPTSEKDDNHDNREKSQQGSRGSMAEDLRQAGREFGGQATDAIGRESERERSGTTAQRLQERSGVREGVGSMEGANSQQDTGNNDTTANGRAVRQLDVADANGRGFTGFFSNISLGFKGKPNAQSFEPVLDVAPIAGFVRRYNQYRGNFDDHIGSSIPTFRELQTIVGDAITKTYSKADMLDIGASEGALNKAITQASEGRIRTVALDPNFAMAQHFAKTPVAGAVYDTSAFGDAAQEGALAWVEDDTLTDRDGQSAPNPFAGSTVRFYKPDRLFDVVHEAMVFQFISRDRPFQIARAKELMKPNGVLILEEKFVAGEALDAAQFRANEEKKDTYKELYFTKEEIAAKAKAVGVAEKAAYQTEQQAKEALVVGMNDTMVSPGQLEADLGDKFSHVVQFWDSGNFKGYMASDSRKALDDLLGNMLPTESAFSNVATPRFVDVQYSKRDLFGGFANSATTVDTDIVISSKGDKLQGGNVDSAGRIISRTKQGLKNFWNWFGQSDAVDAKGKPLLLYHSTQGDISEFEIGRETVNNYGLMGDLKTTRAGIFATPDKDASEGFLRGDADAVMPVYMSLQKALDLRHPDETFLRVMTRMGFLQEWRDSKNDWEMFDNYSDGSNPFVEKLKEYEYDGAIFIDSDENGNEFETYVAFDKNQVKSALGNIGQYSLADNRISYSLRSNLGFYSALSAGIESIATRQQPAGGWLAQIKGLVNKGAVKQDEVTWSGVEDWLQMQEGKVTKEQVKAYLDANGVQVQETVFGQPNDSEVQAWWNDEGGANEEIPFSDLSGQEQRAAASRYVDEVGQYARDGQTTKFSQYTLPGGENYREVLLTLPEKGRAEKEKLHDEVDREYRKNGNSERYAELLKELEAAKGLLANSFKSPHWEQPNVLAHIRLNDRADMDGAKVLFVEELQSDWQQSARKSKNVPLAPFVDKTDKWLALALKRVITMAVEGGHDKVAFVNGEQSAQRYDLSTAVDSVSWHPDTEMLVATKDDSNVIEKTVNRNELDAFIGKDASKNLLQSGARTEDGAYLITGDDLKVGGEGMKTFYDSIVPNAVKALLKKVGGGQLERVRLEGGADQIGFTITQAMRDGVDHGMPLFSKRSGVNPTESYLAQRNKSLLRVTPKSVLEADIDLAVKALDAAVVEIKAGNYRQVSVPIGPMPHVLQMLGARNQMMKVDASIIKKVLVDKHEADFRNITSREFVMALYKPAMVLKAEVQGEYELVSNLVTPNGPIMFIVKRDTRPSAGGPVVASVMSGYAKPVSGGDRSISGRIRAGMLIYADMMIAQEAITGNGLPRKDFTDRRAQFRETPSDVGRIESLPKSNVNVKPLNDKFAWWSSLRGFFVDGIASKKVKDDVSLMAWIGNNFKSDGVDGWGDVPSFSVRSGTSNWDMYENTQFDDLVYKMQNKMIDVKRVIESITKFTGKVADDINVYLQEELFHGRTAKRTQDFVSNELKPMMEAIKKAGYTIADVEEYLHARHAKEANAIIASRNPGDPNMQDGGSGMTDFAADSYFQNLSPAETRKLAAIADLVDDIQARTRQLYADYGLESQDRVDGWEDMFSFYVPLHREDKGGGVGLGQGFSVKGKETRGRTGSKRKVVDILANIAMQRERLIVRGEKNRVAQALVGLAMQNPNPEFWSVGTPPAERVYDPKTNKVVERIDPMFKSRNNVIVSKVKRANGDVDEVAVVFNEDDDRAVRMAAALKNLDASGLEGLLGVSAKITRYFSAVNTQWNPVFGVVNLMRDFQSALINIGTTPLASKKKQIAGDTLHALAGIYSDLRAVRNGKTPSSKWSQLWEEFQMEGAQTGYRDMFATSADRAESLQSMLTPQAWMDGTFGKILTANGLARKPVGKAAEAAQVVFDWLSDYNESMENSMRLAAYKAGVDQGMSKQEAASLAKNLTVNFNRKGQVALQAGALYAFFNAAMQGTARIGTSLFEMEGGDTKTVRLSSLGKKIVYGGMLLGTMQALAMAAAGFGDDDPPEFVKVRSFVIPTGWSGIGPDKGYLSIPMPLGFNVLPGLGRHMTEFALSGFEKPSKRMVSVIGMFADNFNPIGNAGLSMQTLAPTVFDPLVALTENKDFTGKPIAHVSRNQAIPGFAQYKDSATFISKLLAEGINGLTGGNAYVAGALSPTPDQIDYLAGQVGGGVWRELSKVMQTTTSALSGEDMPLYKVPLVGRFAGNAASQASQSGAFYGNVDRLNELETEIKGMRKDGKVVEAQRLIQDKPEAYLIAMANAAERQIQALKKQKRALIDQNADRSVVKAKENQITAVMTRFNQAVEQRKLRSKAAMPVTP